VDEALTSIQLPDGPLSIREAARLLDAIASNLTVVAR
jgi:hypothetical protein